MLAWHASYVLQPHSKKRLTPDMLLPDNYKTSKRKKPIGDSEELKKELSQLKKEFEED